MTTRIFTILSLIILCTTGMLEKEAFAEDKEQVILISFDGMRNDLTRKYVKDGKLPNIKKVTDEGSMAKYAKTISPSLTAPSHAAIATGATPLKTSIVSNAWKEPNAALTSKENAFSSELEVDPLWVEARKQGKTTATVAFAGANPTTGKQGDYTIYYGDTWSPSSGETLKFRKASEWKNAPRTYSPLMESHFDIQIKNQKNHTFYVLAVDSTDDEKVNYDQFIVSERKEIHKESKKTKKGKWGSLTFTIKGNQAAGTWFRFAPKDPRLEEKVNMYRSGVTSGQIDGPKGFRENIRERFGVFPPQDDDRALEKGWISREEYEEISERFVHWVTDVSLFIKEEYQPDLLMFYAPQIDHQEHLYLLSDPRQPGYTAEKSEKYQKYIEWAYQTADDVVGKTINAMDKNDTLFIVSDHGMEPAHSTLEPNKILKDHGLLVTDEKGKVLLNKTKAIAIPSGSAAHIYINLESREKGGIVPEEDYQQVRDEIMNVFKDIEVTRNVNGPLVSHHLGELWSSIRNEGLSLNAFKESATDLYSHILNLRVHPYEMVKPIPKEGTAIRKDHNIGDILLMAAPGYIMGNGMSETVKPAVELGTHGGNPDREKLKAVFIAMGPEFPEGEQIQPISNLDIAPTIYDILGLETPDFVEGEKIKELTEKR
ncbi:alkaline phosphatase family protein [Mesobacillus foraminis]|uniref:alkaline phosphatase family protein n=1 Tax=Mesobacillus foraminis TaxID=279826 RepID=UPI00399F1C51